MVSFAVYLQVHKKKGRPALELRRLTTDIEIIKAIILAAMNNKPLVIYPVFRDRIQAYGSLTQKGILKFNSENNQYQFNI